MGNLYGAHSCLVQGGRGLIGPTHLHHHEGTVSSTRGREAAGLTESTTISELYRRRFQLVPGPLLDTALCAQWTPRAKSVAVLGPTSCLSAFCLDEEARPPIRSFGEAFSSAGCACGRGCR